MEWIDGIGERYHYLEKPRGYGKFLRFCARRQRAFISRAVLSDISPLSGRMSLYSVQSAPQASSNQNHRGHIQLRDVVVIWVVQEMLVMKEVFSIAFFNQNPKSNQAPLIRSTQIQKRQTAYKIHAPELGQK